MPRLLVLRHAKSSWDHPDLRDHDRPLADRGRNAAKRIGRHLKTNDWVPQIVLCSSAVRARQTLELLALPEGVSIEIEAEIYGAGMNDLIELLTHIPPQTESILLIGHNPTLQDLVLALAAEGQGLDSVRAKFPTAALAILEVQDWSSLEPGGAELVAYVTPKKLDS